MPIPPSRNVGDPGHTTDHNNIRQELIDLNTAVDGKAATSHTHAGTDIASGTVPAARLGSGSSITTKFLRGDNTWQPITAADIPHVHDADDVTTGVFATARLGTGSATSLTYLRGDGTWSTPPSGGSGAPGANAILVAASNSPAAIRARADYVCTGANDHIQINAALTTAANQVGGTGTRQSSVILADGDYSLGGPVLIPNRALMFSGTSYLTRLFRQGSGFDTTAGSGTGGALIKLAATEEARSSQLATICNMTLDGTGHASGVSGIIWDTAGLNPLVYSASTYGHPNTDPDSYNTFCDLYIQNVANGILIRGTSSQPRHNYIRRVTVREFNAVGIGGSNSSDNVITESFVQSGRGNNAIGIQTPGGSTTISNCKASYISVSGSTGGIGYSITSSRAMVTSCESQDNPFGINITGTQAMVTGFKADTQVANSTRAVFIGATDCRFDGVIQTRSSGSWDRGLEFASTGHDHHVDCQILSSGITKRVNVNNGSEITDPDNLPLGLYRIRVSGDPGTSLVR